MTRQPTRSDWVQTYTGKAFFPLDPKVEDIDIKDIAWSLSMQCRYNGHTTKFYSVAEHCVHVSHAVPNYIALDALMHDAAEAYITDLPRPLKAMIPEYKVYEERIMECVAERFQLKYTDHPNIKEADTRILGNERAAVMNPSSLEWTYTGKPMAGVFIKCWSPQEAYDQFMWRFTQLMNKA